jgi:hypothetical protein
VENQERTYTKVDVRGRVGVASRRAPIVRKLFINMEAAAAKLILALVLQQEMNLRDPKRMLRDREKLNEGLERGSDMYQR